MDKNDAQLIREILSGDDAAFSILVDKYQKSIHALAWRKIGDFHIAEEIAQDAFLQAYTKLTTLRNPQQFAGWLYVIANRLCINWIRKQKPVVQSLEDTSVKEIDSITYERYVAEQRETQATERRHEIVKKLLDKLPESERTVVTLYYLGEMTAKEIGKFLGVSIKTINSRLHRARNRLKEQEHMIRETLGSVHMPTTFTENVMRQIADIKPVSPSSNKPLIPVAISTATAILVFLLMGVGTQYLSRFQEPYNLNATSESTVEIIEALFVLDTPAKPDVRNQPGSSTVPGKTIGAGQKPDAPLFAALPIDEAEVSTTQPQWTQTKGPEGGSVSILFMASNDDLYAGSGTSLYKLKDNGQVWSMTNFDTPFKGSWQITEHGDTLYVTSDTEVFASTDRGRTWNSFGPRPDGHLIGSAITDDALYLGLIDGVFRSTDTGKSWMPINDNLGDRKIRAITVVENALFVGTDSGLYRRNAQDWEELSLGKAENIRALASTEHQLYAVVGEEVTNQLTSQIMSAMTARKATFSLFRSTDLGNSWQAINPEKGLPVKTSGVTFGTIGVPEAEPTSTLKIMAVEDSILVLDSGRTYYSSDIGKTWTTLHSSHSDMNKPPVAVMLNENTFYRGGRDGVHRTTDAGKTWQQFNTGLVNTSITNLVAVHNTLYANIGYVVLSSSDGGESWTPTLGNPGNLMRMVEFNDALYARGAEGMNPRLFRLSAEDNKLTSVPGMPVFGDTGFEEQFSEKFNSALLKSISDEDKKNLEAGKNLSPEHFDDNKFNEAYSQVMESTMTGTMQSILGSFAVSDGIYYMESSQTLFRWKPGTTEWYNTGLVDETGAILAFADFNDFTAAGFQIAASSSTVYVGKRNGRLFQSYDKGDTWKDVTADLPLSVTSFNAITFAESTVYVATDKGVGYSTDGERWHATTDVEGTPLIIERFAVDGTIVYGTTEQRVYQLNQNSGIWQPVTSEVPSTITSVAISGRTLYVGTLGRGVLRFARDESY